MSTLYFALAEKKVRGFENRTIGSSQVSVNITREHQDECEGGVRKFMNISRVASIGHACQNAARHADAIVFKASALVLHVL